MGTKAPTESETQTPGPIITFETLSTPARVEPSGLTYSPTQVQTPGKVYVILPPSSPETQSEVQTSKESATQKSKTEEKSSSKLKFYNGGGRRHTDEQIDEILDWYLITRAEIGIGQLPKYVSDRQRYHYRHHARLEDRRKLLEQAGQLSKVTASESNVFDLAERKTQHKRRSSRHI